MPRQLHLLPSSEEMESSVRFPAVPGCLGEQSSQQPPTPVHGKPPASPGTGGETAWPDSGSGLCSFPSPSWLLLVLKWMFPGGSCRVKSSLDSLALSHRSTSDWCSLGHVPAAVAILIVNRESTNYMF